MRPTPSQSSNQPLCSDHTWGFQHADTQASTVQAKLQSHTELSDRFLTFEIHLSALFCLVLMSFLTNEIQKSTSRYLKPHPSSRLLPCVVIVCNYKFGTTFNSWEKSSLLQSIEVAYMRMGFCFLSKNKSKQWCMGLCTASCQTKSKTVRQTVYKEKGKTQL